ncbi:hypothetical protein CR983_02300 [Candidatus Saccharibacteria bacterium]|nr:MAG: hypothetical protein CR983_02300 [Candidatus Saccharibacteria bacterium]
MQSTITKLQRLLPGVAFARGADFAWNPEESRITYRPSGTVTSLLHEAGHARLHHASYRKDIELVMLERDAWEAARDIAHQLNTTLDDQEVEAHLDSYRDWLHARSTCPTCGANGLQAALNSYRCIECSTRWRVNEARTCALRRYSLTEQPPKNHPLETRE